MARGGMLLPCPRRVARPHDRNPVEGLVAGCRRLAPADQGFLKLALQPPRAQARGGSVVMPCTTTVPPSRSPTPLLKACARWRKLGETVGSHLTERVAGERMRVHDVWPLQHRLIRTVLAHTVAVLLHLTLGRQPLDLDGLVAARSQKKSHIRLRNLTKNLSLNALFF
jgi:hypothetical protein